MADINGVRTEISKLNNYVWEYVEDDKIRIYITNKIEDIESCIDELEDSIKSLVEGQ